MKKRAANTPCPRQSRARAGCFSCEPGPAGFHGVAQGVAGRLGGRGGGGASADEGAGEGGDDGLGGVLGPIVIPVRIHSSGTAAQRASPKTLASLREGGGGEQAPCAGRRLPPTHSQSGGARPKPPVQRLGGHARTRIRGLFHRHSRSRPAVDRRGTARRARRGRLAHTPRCPGGGVRRPGPPRATEWTAGRPDGRTAPRAAGRPHAAR